MKDHSIPSWQSGEKSSLASFSPLTSCTQLRRNAFKSKTTEYWNIPDFSLFQISTLRQDNCTFPAVNVSIWDGAAVGTAASQWDGCKFVVFQWEFACSRHFYMGVPARSPSTHEANWQLQIVRVDGLLKLAVNCSVIKSIAILMI